MRAAPAGLALLLAACRPSGAGEDADAPWPTADEADATRSEFLSKAAGDAWANWPADRTKSPASDRQPCVRVAEHARDESIHRLARQPAVGIDAREYKQLTGQTAPAGDGALYLLRGFATNGSVASAEVIDGAVTVHSDALGGLWNLRRHPCVASLVRPPSAVYTTAAYDL
jgi:hypothetical protein